MKTIDREKLERLKDMRLAFALLGVAITAAYYLFIDDPAEKWEALAFSGFTQYILLRLICAIKEEKKDFRFWTYEKRNVPAIYYLVMSMHTLAILVGFVAIFGYLLEEEDDANQATHTTSANARPHENEPLEINALRHVARA